MNILSVIYSIPLPNTSPPSSSVSVGSTQPSSPSSTSPTSDTSDIPGSLSRQHSQQSLDSRPKPEPYAADVTDVSDGLLAIGKAMFETSDSSGGLSPVTPVAPSLHPYAAAPAVSRPPPPTPPRSQVGRPRASSTLPPAAPPPTSLLPPAPGSVVESSAQSDPRIQKPADLPATGRQRGQSISHKRTGSASRLAVLPEELERGYEPRQYGDTLSLPSVDADGRPRSRSSQRDPNRESHPLPPLPSPVPSDLTPRTGVANLESRSPKNSTFNTRPRGGSTLSIGSNATTSSSPREGTPLINASPGMGTISQRRNKASTSPSAATSASSPTESIASNATMPNMPRSSASAISSTTAANLSLRPRAESQPVHRSTPSYPSPPQSAAFNGQPRKVSVPSRLGPNAPPSITINTALLSPPLSRQANAHAPLVPPPPIPHGNIPAAPMSPLPPSAPSDPLRKPYHMMNLLRQTMVSKTGGYITRRLHVPQEVWSQGGAKLSNVPEKIRVVEVLSSALEEIQTWSVEYFGAGSVSSGMAMGIGSIGKKEADMWAAKLEEFSVVCDGVVSNFGKKLGVGEGFVTKKSSGVRFISPPNTARPS